MPKKLVLCIARKKMEAQLGGEIPLGFSISNEIFNKATTAFLSQGEFIEREQVEEDETILQAIVYGVVSDGSRVLGLWRKQRQIIDGEFKETRHNKKIGLAAGGHLEPRDGFGDFSYFNNEILREFSEELLFQVPPRPVPVGIIMYEETALDRVHLGLIYKVIIQADKVSLAPDNDEYDKCNFLMPTELPELRDQMEGWGKVIADAIISETFSLG
jgi:predicted NUDIX family phosphoesterase